MTSSVSCNQRCQSAKIDGIQSPWDLLLELSNSILGFPFDLLYSSANASWQASALVDNSFFLAQSRFPFLAREKLAVQLIDFKFGINSCDVYDRFVNQLFSNRQLNLKYMQRFFSELGLIQIRSCDPVGKQKEENIGKEADKKANVEPKAEIKQEVCEPDGSIHLASGSFFDDECFIQEYEVECDPFSEMSEQINGEGSKTSDESPSNQTPSYASQSNSCTASDGCRSQSQCSDTTYAIQSKDKDDHCQSDSSNEDHSRHPSEDLSIISESSIGVASVKQDVSPPIKKEFLDETKKELSPTKSEKHKKSAVNVIGAKSVGEKGRESPKDKSKSKSNKLESSEEDEDYEDLEYGKYAKKSKKCADKETSSEKTDASPRKTDENGGKTREKVQNQGKEKSSHKAVDKVKNDKTGGEDIKNEKCGRKDSKNETNGSGKTLKNDADDKNKKKSSNGKDYKRLSFKIINNCRDPRLTKKRKLEGFDY